MKPHQGHVGKYVSEYMFLWWEDSPKKSLEVRLSEALKHIAENTHQKSTICLVHPKELGEEQTLCGITVKPWSYALPNHYFFIFEEK